MLIEISAATSKSAARNASHSRCIYFCVLSYYVVTLPHEDKKSQDPTNPKCTLLPLRVKPECAISLYGAVESHCSCWRRHAAGACCCCAKRFPRREGGK